MAYVDHLNDLPVGRRMTEVTLEFDFSESGSFDFEEPGIFHITVGFENRGCALKPLYPVKIQSRECIFEEIATSLREVNMWLCVFECGMYASGKPCMLPRLTDHFYLKKKCHRRAGSS